MASTPESDVRSSTPRLANGEGHDDATGSPDAAHTEVCTCTLGDFWAWLMNAKVRPAVMESKYLEMARQLEAAKLALEAAAELQVELYPTPPISATLSPSQKSELIKG